MQDVEKADAPPELWALCGPYWQLPISVTLFSNTALIDFWPIELLTIQKAAIMDAIKESGAQHYNDHWWLTRPALEATAMQMPDGTNPEQIVVWGKPGEKATVVTDDGSAEDFLAFWCRTERVVQDASTARVIWISMMKSAMDWLYNQQKPLPMMFCNMHAMPFRHNWKEILRSLDPIAIPKEGESEKPLFFAKSAKTAKHLSQKDIVERGVMKNLFLGTFQGWGTCTWSSEWAARNHTDKVKIMRRTYTGKSLQWTLETEPTPVWRKLCVTGERQKQKHYGWANYMMNLIETIKRHLPYATILYRDYLQKYIEPCTVLPRLMRSGQTDRNGAKQGKLGIFGKKPFPFRGNNTFPVEAIPSLTGDGGGQDGGVSRLPDLCAVDEELRSDEGEMVQPSDTEG